jgi:hypothetical protein
MLVNPFLRRAVAWASVLGAIALLAGCTPYRLEHPVYGQSRLQDDTSECNRFAYLQSERSAFYDRVTTPLIPFRGADGRVYYRPAPSFGMRNRLWDEQIFRSDCMRFKGYRAVPDVDGPPNPAPPAKGVGDSEIHEEQR